MAGWFWLNQPAEQVGFSGSRCVLHLHRPVSRRLLVLRPDGRREPLRLVVPRRGLRAGARRSGRLARGHHLRGNRARRGQRSR